MISAGTTLDHTHDHAHLGRDFDGLASALRARFTTLVDLYGPFQFETDAMGLYDAYLGNLPAHERQHHTCNCCRRFIETFGGLVFMSEEGTQVPLWDSADVPSAYIRSVDAMREIVKGARVTGVFFCEDPVWGVFESGGFSHFAIEPHPMMRWTSRTKTAHQAMAAKKEDYRTLSAGLAEFSPDLVAQALHLLSSEALANPEPVLGPAKFLSDLQLKRASKRGPAANNVVWYAVSRAPAGFCTPRSSMIGTLLDDLRSGYALDTVKRRFAAKMGPLAYRRPQAPAKAGTIAAAEKLAEKMNLGPALKRRYARIEECDLIWKPTTEKAPATGGLFGHLAPKGGVIKNELVDTAAQRITWSKFARTVMPTALGMQVHTDHAMNLMALVTAEDPNAIPILQWDREEKRNQVSWYVYPHGSNPTNWGLPLHKWIEVTGITLQPSMWDGQNLAHLGHSAVLLLKDCADKGKPGLALFPQLLRSELHEVRAVIEQFSNAGTPSGRENATANGLRVGGEEKASAAIRVKSAGGTSTYIIDRWE